MPTAIETSRPRSAIAAKVCQELRFIEFLCSLGHKANDIESAQNAVRSILGISSLSEIVDEVANVFDERILRPYLAVEDRSKS